MGMECKGKVNDSGWQGERERIELLRWSQKEKIENAIGINRRIMENEDRNRKDKDLTKSKLRKWMVKKGRIIKKTICGYKRIAKVNLRINNKKASKG